MTEALIKLRVLRRWLRDQAKATWCGVAGHRWNLFDEIVRCQRCGKPGW